MLMTVLRGERAIKQRRALMRTFKQIVCLFLFSLAYSLSSICCT